MYNSINQSINHVFLEAWNRNVFKRWRKVDDCTAGYGRSKLTMNKSYLLSNYFTSLRSKYTQ